MKKKFLCVTALVTMSAVMMLGCGKKKEEATTTTEVTEATKTDAEEDDENYETGDASKDNPRNQDEIGDNELLVVSFGTSFNDSRVNTIGAIENDIEAALGDKYSVRRGFTSQIIIDHVKKRDGEVIDNVAEALDRAIANGVKNLVIQPTHLMSGYEYNDLIDEVAMYADSFESVRIGTPLITSDEDMKTVIKAITEDTAEYDDGKTAICFMGHGTEAASNSVYARIQSELKSEGYDNYYIGTVEAEPSLDDVITLVDAGNYERVVLQPLMIVAGDHANNDMAGDDEDSWKSAFEAKGYKVECRVRGLGEISAIRELIVKHAEDVVNQNPIYGDKIKDGDYEIEVSSSSSMFNIDKCELSVKEGKMTAKLYMSGTGYLKLFMGNGEKATNAKEDEYIPFEETADGVHTFTVPVYALDVPVTVSAFSKKKELWYDRQLVFKSGNIPSDAISGLYKTVSELELEDGEYKIDAKLAGGSGKTSVESPAKLYVEGGKAYVEFAFTSPNYDYVKIGDVKYDPVNESGNSTFKIPVEGLDYDMPIIGDTVAMSEPHEIEYTLYFDSTTIAK